MSNQTGADKKLAAWKRLYGEQNLEWLAPFLNGYDAGYQQACQDVVARVRKYRYFEDEKTYEQVTCDQVADWLEGKKD